MSTHALDLPSFRGQFTEFASQADATIQMYWGMATTVMSPNDGCLMSGPFLQLALNLMTAHLLKSFLMINAGQTSVVVAGSTEGSVSVSLVAPPVKNGWQWWLSTTPYGAQLWGMLQMKSAGGFFIGGSLERASFRKAGGIF